MYVLSANEKFDYKKKKILFHSSIQFAFGYVVFKRLNLFVCTGATVTVKTMGV